jgi:hypothetical protein
MFDSSSSAGSSARPGDRHRSSPPLAELRARARPISDQRSHRLAVDVALADLLPDRSLPRGSTVVVRAGGSGATTLALALVAAASAAGSWCVAVGIPDLGGVAAEHLAVDLARLALVPCPGSRWAATVALLADEIDLVLCRPPGTVTARVARQLAARLRTRRSVLVVVGPQPWPERCDLELRVGPCRWTGTARGAGHLAGRLATVTAVPHRGAGRTRSTLLWLPGPDGRVQPAAHPQPAAGP